MLKNPIRSIREDVLNMDRKTFCAIYAIPMSTLAGAETGATFTLGDSVKEALRRAGLSWEQIHKIPEQYRQWQRAMAEEAWKKRKEAQSVNSAPPRV